MSANAAVADNMQKSVMKVDRLFAGIIGGQGLTTYQGTEARSASNDIYGLWPHHAATAAAAA